MIEVGVREKILVGVSGGADSMALWHWLVAQGHEVVACYVNHHQRPDENRVEIATIQQFAQQIKSRYRIEMIAPEALANRVGNFQNFAREQRYAIWHTCMQELGIEHLALAHHSDDLLETVLMRLTRGTSPSGLIPFQEVEVRQHYTLLRPFYTWNKQQIYAYCEQFAIPYCEDSSNEKDTYLRNRYRHHIVPVLEAENAHVANQVRHFVEQLKQIDDYLMNEAEKIAAEIFIQRKNYGRVTINLLKNKPIALQSAVFKIILRYVYFRSDYSISETGLNRLLEMIESTNRSEQFIWQQRVFERNYAHLYMYRSEDFIAKPAVIQLGQQARFGHYEIVDVLSVRPKSLKQLCYPYEYRKQISIRTPQAGDRITLGNGQHKKLQRLFIDHKVPRFLRSTWPIAVYDEEIIWVYDVWQRQEAFGSLQVDATVIIKEEAANDARY